MKTRIHFLAVAGVALALAAEVNSQTAQVPRTPVQQLQAMRAKNAELIEKQAATLQKLEEMRLQAQQLKFLGKRS